MTETEERIAVATNMSDKLCMKHISLDRAWFKLQEQHIFILLVPLGVTQLTDFSDNWERRINWDEKMLKL